MRLLTEYEKTYIPKRTIISDAHLLSFANKKYYIAYNILSGEIVYKSNKDPRQFYPENSNVEQYRLDKDSYITPRYIGIPCALPLKSLKGFIRTLAYNRSLSPEEEAAKYLEYDYLEISLEEAMILYGLEDHIQRVHDLRNNQINTPSINDK